METLKIKLFECVKKVNPTLTFEIFDEIYNQEMKKNKLIYDYLEYLELYYKKQKDVFRSKAYQKAKKTIKELNYPLMSKKQLNNLPGIGQGISKKIDQIIQTSQLKIKETENFDLIRLRTIELFTSLWGIGQEQAMKWYDKGYRTLDDVKPFLTKSQLLAYQYKDQLSQKIPIEDVEEFQKQLDKILKNIEYTITGSYRRRLPLIGDIDILISNKEAINLALSKLKTKGILREGTSTTAIVQINDRIAKVDFFYVPKSSWATGLIARTGPQDFVIEMRKFAAKNGFKLTDTELSKNGIPIPTPTEKSVFDQLNLEYVYPTDRYGVNQIAIKKPQSYYNFVF